MIAADFTRAQVEKYKPYHAFLLYVTPPTMFPFSAPLSRFHCCSASPLVLAVALPLAFVLSLSLVVSFSLRLLGVYSLLLAWEPKDMIIGGTIWKCEYVREYER
jgi:hypothetical protein